MRIALVVVLVLATLPFSAAPATAAAEVLYECEIATYHTNLPYTPVSGYPCSGPLGTAPAGTVVDLSTDTSYYCTPVTGSLIDGGLFVFGNICSP